MTNNTPTRIIAIGDIHGCSTALRSLIDLIQPTVHDTVVTLGDYVNRGPDSKGVLELLLELSVICKLIPILGNHDEAMLAGCQREQNPEEWKRMGGSQRDRELWLHMGGQTTIDSYGGNLAQVPDEHLDFLRNCLNYHLTDTYFFTHANFAPNLRWEDHDGWTLRWRSLETPYPSPHFSGTCVVVGHTPQPDGHILDLPHLKCLDTGMGLGGLLTALDLTNGSTWQVNESGQSPL